MNTSKYLLVLAFTFAFLNVHLSTSIPIIPQTSCIGNCFSCPESPYTCSYSESLLFPKQNRNCLGYWIGETCTSVADGFQKVESDGLTGWSNGSIITGRQSCALYHTSANTSRFSALPSINTSTTITKNLTFNRDSVDILIIKASFTVIEQNGSTILTMVGQNFATMGISVGGESFNLELMYPEALSTEISNSTCGVGLTYLYRYNLPQTLSNPSIMLNITGTNNHNWSMSSVDILAGCGGFMISNGSTKCSACASGFYPIQTQETVLMGCAKCDESCLTCTQTRCTMCQPKTQYNSTTGLCSIMQGYMNVNSYTVAEGVQLPTNSEAINFLNLIRNDATTNSVGIESRLMSPAPYLLKFSIIFSQTFPQTLTSPLTISQSTTPLLSLSASEFKPEIGFYDSRLSNGTQKYFVKNVQIDRLNIENLNRNLLIKVSKTGPSEDFYVANYEVVQYQCVDGCRQCDLRTNTCLQCEGFFINNGSCKACPNGFYKTLVSTSSNESPKCLKCHSSCMQCSGPNQSDCKECFPNFQLQTPTYNRFCIECLHSSKGSNESSSECSGCLQTYSSLLTDIECTACMNSDTNIYESETCLSCYQKYSLSSSRCVTTPASSLTLYGSDLTGTADSKDWSTTSGRTLGMINCSADYPNMYGIGNASGNGTIVWRQSNLPTHVGLYLIVDVLKLDIETQTNTAGVPVYPNISIAINNNETYNLELANRKNGTIEIPGANICSGNGKEMIQTFTFNSPKHTSSEIQVSVTSPNGGVYLRQLQLYLGQCQQCNDNKLSYEIKYIPRYPYNNTQSSGLDIWIEFNKIVSVDEANRKKLKDAFSFEIDQMRDKNLTVSEFVDDLELNNRLKYYLPLDENIVNGSLIVNVNPDAGIFGQELSESRRLLINFPLELTQSEQVLRRFSSLDDDNLVSSTQIYWFFTFFQWFALITMIICIMLGIGVVFEEFSILLQLLFLHVYISMQLLPATFRAPLIGLERMENLNYFANPSAQSIEWQWFEDYVHPSPYIFTVYNKDILFERSYYPTIIINLIYLGWFIILFILYKVLPKFQTSNSTIVGFIRNIPARPLNYMDQIWRYQFITTMWAAFMQFHILKGDTAWERFNLALCFICFIFSLLWPVFVVCYTYKLNSIKYSTEFMYKYEDIYFKKMESISEGKLKYFNYVFIRFARYFIIALFICVFTEHEIIGPVILICANLIEILYVGSLRIFYNSVAGAVLKIGENLLFIAIEVALLIVYALSDNAADGDFLNLGYALIVLYVIAIILGLLRICYYLYYKFKTMKYIMKFGKDNGEIVQVGPTPLPNTDRYDA